MAHQRLLAAVALAAAARLVTAVEVSLPRTGQESCYDHSGAQVACTGTGHDGEIRHGVVWPEPRFVETYCNASGPCPSQTTDCDGEPANDLMTDRLTGLVWPRDPQVVGSSTWSGAFALAETLDLCGHSDWRVANVNELASLMRLEEEPISEPPEGKKTPGDWLEMQGFLPVCALVWSSTTYEFNPVIASGASFADGSASGDFKSASRCVWPVRGLSSTATAVFCTGQHECWDGDGAPISCAGTGHDGETQEGAAWPQPRFADNGDGSVTDLFTGLVWLKDLSCLEAHVWIDAFTTVDELVDDPGSFACDSYVDSGRQWRLPNKFELQSLVDRSNYGPALADGHDVFVNIPTYANYWSCTTTTYTLSTINAWVMSISNGALGGNVKSSTNRVWPVSGESNHLIFVDGFESGGTSAWGN